MAVVLVDMAEYSYRHNDETGRWDVIKRLPDGTEEVLHSFTTSDEAMNYAAQLTGKEPREIPPGKWVSTEE